MSKPSYRILITSLEALGHINATIGFGEMLSSHGHEVIFVQRQKYKGLADSRGFKFIPLDEEILGAVFENAVSDWVDTNMETFRADPLTRIKNMTEQDKKNMALNEESFVKLDLALTKVLHENPGAFDAIAADACDVVNCLFNSGLPVIPLMSGNPKLLYKGGPPAASGLSINDDPKIWDEFAEIYQEAFKEMQNVFNKLLKKGGRKEYYYGNTWVLPLRHFGFYQYPSDLDYSECEPKHDEKWFRVDSYVRSADDTNDFELPESLSKKSGKLIYLSLGTLGSNDLLVMRKLINAASKSSHRFIISKGSRGDQLELADNMCGENYLNQIKVIQMVDLVITHGGNNTFMETLYYGKPMIVVPYFFDQFDNAQRVVDKKIGFRVNPYDLDEDYFLDCIEKALSDQEMQNRVKAISQNMKNSKRQLQAVKMIENLIEEFKSK
ncbi:uncharacterized UDP-glucosyltransferase YdhE-like [Tetranychus urticae]|uniref:UDP-glycosyltransferase 201E1 n=1 Tax=Tetranychus urticae TaxID=32264 RepID=T1K5B8_TETUR|nr:uncharacterized UDP-glucosyltransferase YdhE-like [Tetranychus urticae]AHX56867.1 UDP-glycosyltransferase 201E1 [Tetranychus urticae]